MKGLTTFQSDLLTDMINHFKKKSNEYDKRDWHHEWEGERLYPKWVSTSTLSEIVGMSCNLIRKDLNVLEKLGFIKSSRHPNWITWSVVDIQGFKDHIFRDYKVRSN